MSVSNVQGSAATPARMDDALETMSRALVQLADSYDKIDGGAEGRRLLGVVAQGLELCESLKGLGHDQELAELKQSFSVTLASMSALHIARGGSAADIDAALKDLSPEDLKLAQHKLIANMGKGLIMGSKPEFWAGLCRQLGETKLNNPDVTIQLNGMNVDLQQLGRIGADL